MPPPSARSEELLYEGRASRLGDGQGGGRLAEQRRNAQAAVDLFHPRTLPNDANRASRSTASFGFVMPRYPLSTEHISEQRRSCCGCVRSLLADVRKLARNGPKRSAAAPGRCSLRRVDRAPRKGRSGARWRTPRPASGCGRSKPSWSMLAPSSGATGRLGVSSVSLAAGPVHRRGHGRYATGRSHVQRAKRRHRRLCDMPCFPRSLGHGRREGKGAYFSRRCASCGSTRTGKT